MSHSGRLRLDEVRRVFRLVGEIRELGDDARRWRTHMLTELSRTLGGFLGMSTAFRLPLPDLSKPFLDPWVEVGWADDRQRAVWFAYLADGAIGRDPLNGVIPHAAAAGRQVTCARQRLVDDRAWYRNDVVNDYRLAGGVDQCVYSFVPVPHVGRLDTVMLHRRSGDKPFAPREVGFLRLFHRELSRFWEPGAAIGEPGPRHPAVSLPPFLRRTLDLLCKNFSEKQVAARLGLSRHTTHGYVKDLHRRFGVESRGELIARAQFSRPQFVPRLEVD